MNAWRSSWLYGVWVVGGLSGVVAFAVVGGTSDPSNQDFIFTLIPVIAVWVAGIFVLQWLALQRERRLPRRPPPRHRTGPVWGAPHPQPGAGIGPQRRALGRLGGELGSF